MDANGMTFFSMGKSNEFWEIMRISPGNNAKLGGSFAEIRNVCIFALPMRLKINRMFPARHAIRKQRTCSYGMKAEQEPVGEHMV